MVRRSDRVKASCNGYKGNVCKARNCVGCSSEPPTLSSSSLKKIGTSFCQIQPDLVDDHILFKKKKTNPIGKNRKRERMRRASRGEMKQIKGRMMKMMKQAKGRMMKTTARTAETLATTVLIYGQQQNLEDCKLECAWSELGKEVGLCQRQNHREQM